MYDKVNSKELWQVLRMYDVGGKLLNRIKNMYDTSLVYVRDKWGENESRVVGDKDESSSLGFSMCKWIQ